MALGRVSANSIYCVPRSFATGNLAKSLIESGHALPFAGTDHAFAAVEVMVRSGEGVDRYTASITAFDPWRHILGPEQRKRFSSLLEAISVPREPFAGVPLTMPAIMGVVNVTPDSFSDGGDHVSVESAIEHAFSLTEAGANILDVGGESTRPGAEPVDPVEEQARVIPVVRALAEKGFKISIDTRNVATMLAALAAGAEIVNDVSALTSDENAVFEVSNHDAPVILMHMQGKPQTMQSNPSYMNVLLDVYDYLEQRVDACLKAGLKREKICIDPGIGFGKSVSDNLALLDGLAIFQGLGCAVMLGASRKSFIGKLSDEDDPKERLAGSISSALSGVSRGAQILRVHDVRETHQALTVWNAINGR